MRSLRRFLTRLVNSATRRAEEERLRDEIEEHLALLTADNLRAGLPPVEAAGVILEKVADILTLHAAGNRLEALRKTKARG